MTLEPAGKEGLRDQLRERIATRSGLVPRAAAARHAGRRGERAAGSSCSIAIAAGARSRRWCSPAAEHALKPVEPSRLLDAELDKLSGGGARARRAHAAPGGAGVRDAAGRARAGGARRAIRRSPARSRSCAARAAPTSFASASRRAGRGGSRARCRRCSPSDGEWDVEYYVEGRDAAGAVACRAGDAAAPLRFRRAGTVAVAASGAARRAGTCGRRWPSSPRARPRPASTSRPAPTTCRSGWCRHEAPRSPPPLLALACGCKQPQAQLACSSWMSTRGALRHVIRQTSSDASTTSSSRTGRDESSSHCTAASSRARQPVRPGGRRQGAGGVQAVARHAAADHARGPARLSGDGLQLRRMPAQEGFLGDDRRRDGAEGRRLRRRRHRAAGDGDPAAAAIRRSSSRCRPTAVPAPRSATRPTWSCAITSPGAVSARSCRTACLPGRGGGPLWTVDKEVLTRVHRRRARPAASRPRFSRPAALARALLFASARSFRLFYYLTGARDENSIPERRPAGRRERRSSASPPVTPVRRRSIPTSRRASATTSPPPARRTRSRPARR